MPLHIADMFEQGTAFWQYVHHQSRGSKALDKFVVIGPILHGPDRTGGGRDGNIPSQTSIDGLRHDIMLARKFEAQARENEVLIGAPIFQLQPIRLRATMDTD